MIVPIIFEMTEEEVPYLWIFYKYMFFCLENNYPIIALEEYFSSPELYKEKQDSIFKNNKDGYNPLWEFPIPTEKDIKKVKKVSITKEEVNQLTKSYDNKFDTLTSIIKDRNETFERILQEKIDFLEEKYKKKIEVLLTWAWVPSLDYIAKKNNIVLITQELSTYRKNTYNQCLGFFTNTNKYDSKRTLKEFEEYKKTMNLKKQFTRKELLALFLSTDCLKYIKGMYNKIQYEFGIDLGLDKDVFVKAYSNHTNKEIIEKCSALVGKDRVVCRTHPMHPSKDKFKNMDNSVNSVEWILKCQRIVTSLSNMGFEAMLFGKTSYILEETMPFYIEAVHQIDYLEDKIASVAFLNYLTFAYFVPYQLMFDKKYILWRCKKNPSVREIYDYNLSYLLEKKHLTEDIFDQASDSRIKTILMKQHHFSSQKAQEFIQELNQNDLKTREEELQKKNSENEILQKELSRILNSKGWKLLEKLRRIRKK